MSALAILWFVLVAVLIAGYFALDGFDLGVGVLYPFIGKGERDKAVMRRAIGPVWDGNEVWNSHGRRRPLRGVRPRVRHHVLRVLPCGDARALWPYRACGGHRVPWSRS